MKTWANVNALYQIYPRSFNDTNSDGVGDIRGIIEKLDYIRSKHRSLGIDAIWLSPFFTSPMVDAGYDVSNYRDVDPIFGTLADFKELLGEAHKRGIKVVIDFVPNHTSDQHSWFQEALQGPTSKTRDYYVWKDPGPGGGVPNNWVSIFGGSAWHYDERSGQYYLHSFFKEQPDLNWENPAVRAEMKDILRFWLDLGVDGFRVDAIWHMSKDAEFRDEPLNPDYDGPAGGYSEYIRCYSKYGPKLHEYLRELTGVVEGYPDKIMFFESSPDESLGPVVDQYIALYDVNSRIGLPFNFGGMFLPWGAKPFGDYIRDFQSMLRRGDRAAYCFSNHDQPRIVSRFGRSQARLIAMLLLTLPGIPTIYYGDEIGMSNGHIGPDERQDWSQQPGQEEGRDPERTPMQWNASSAAGFSNAKTWLPVAKNYKRYNVAAETADKDSFLALYRKLLQLRNKDETMIKGDFHELSNDGRRNVLVYERTHESAKYLVALNFSPWYRRIKLERDAAIVCSTRTHPVKKPLMIKKGEVILGPYEGVVVAV